MILYLSMILGIIAVILGKLNKVFILPDFSWGVFVKNNLISTCLTVVCGLILVINQRELIDVLKQVIPKLPFVTGGLFSAILGAGGVTIFQFLVDLANPSKRTKIGLNK